MGASEPRAFRRATRLRQSLRLLPLLLASLLQLTSAHAQTASWANLSAPLAQNVLGNATVTGPDGKIYVIGGYVNGIGTTGVQVYDPANPAAGWTRSNWQPDAGMGARAVTGRDGKIYYLGGYVSVFDPSNPVAGWVTLSAQPASNHIAGAGATVGLDGKIYLIGGAGYTPDNQTTEVYDPTNPSAGWVTLPSLLNTGRFSLQAVTGSDGKIYVLGGGHRDASSTLIIYASVEVYDPANPTAGWTTLPTALNTPRLDMSAVTGPDGRIYAIGGYDGGSTDLTSVEVFDPANPSAGWILSPNALKPANASASATVGFDGTLYNVGGDAPPGESYFSGWNALFPQLDTFRSSLALAAGSDGRLYALGGLDLNGNPLATAEVYDPDYAASGWSSAAISLQTPRYGLAATTGSDGLLYAVGGRDATTVYGLTEAYDPAGPAAGWIAVPALNTARYAHAVVSASDGKLYAIGGISSQSTTLGSIEVYDPNALSPQWSTLSASLNAPRSHFGAVAASDGMIYAIGGASNSGTIYGSVERFDPANPATGWTTLTKASLRTAREDFTAVAGADGRIYAIGGKGKGGKLLNSVEVYDPSNPTAGWVVTRRGLNTARADFGATTGSDDKLYVVGGTGTSGTLGSVETLLQAGGVPIALTANTDVESGLTATLATPAPKTGLLLSLTYNPAAPNAPTGLLIPAGATQATVTINGIVDAATTVTASFRGRSVSIVLNPLPTLQSVSPFPLLTGSGAQTITLTGSGFISSSTVLWNGQARTSQYVSPTTLTASLTAADVAKSGTATVQVSNPAPYGGMSNPLVEFIGEPQLSLSGASGLRGETGVILFRATLTNRGGATAPNVSITTAKLGSTATNANLPIALGNIVPGQGNSVSLTFPGTAGTTGTKRTLTLSGTYGSGQAWTASLSVTLP
jgi:N-acetylneuraminic acid mutarotase